MSVGIIDLFEAIQIDQHECEGLLGFRKNGHFFGKHGTIGEFRQMILPRKLNSTFALCLQFMCALQDTRFKHIVELFQTSIGLKQLKAFSSSRFSAARRASFCRLARRSSASNCGAQRSHGSCIPSSKLLALSNCVVMQSDRLLAFRGLAKGVEGKKLGRVAFCQVTGQQID